MHGEFFPQKRISAFMKPAMSIPWRTLHRSSIDACQTAKQRKKKRALLIVHILIVWLSQLFHQEHADERVLRRIFHWRANSSLGSNQLYISYVGGMRGEKSRATRVDGTNPVFCDLVEQFGVEATPGGRDWRRRRDGRARRRKRQYLGGICDGDIEKGRRDSGYQEANGRGIDCIRDRIRTTWDIPASSRGPAAPSAHFFGRRSDITLPLLFFAAEDKDRASWEGDGSPQRREPLAVAPRDLICTVCPMSYPRQRREGLNNETVQSPSARSLGRIDSRPFGPPSGNASLFEVYTVSLTIPREPTRRVTTTCVRLISRSLDPFYYGAFLLDGQAAAAESSSQKAHLFELVGSFAFLVRLVLYLDNQIAKSTSYLFTALYQKF
ncbi:hypothetical protein ARMSODRAFT_974460 [Armillaria solidipes]|uniref:Uncharacterized protein n=1 Tax=Armillaria solidipes TaxID=1076256 RepID=A0A2H3BI54_9AGAR|nr:hypothetical protein ARMSODRAFT_974460 [Armillaria solidipes]